MTWTTYNQQEVLLLILRSTLSWITMTKDDWDFLLMTCANQQNLSSGQVYVGPYQVTSETPNYNTEPTDD